MNRNRISGAPWFEHVKNLFIFVGGAGGTGSHFIINAIRAGFFVTVMDDDAIEEHNLTGQLLSKHHIGMCKVDGILQVANYLGDSSKLTSFFDRLTSSTEIISAYKYNIVVSCFDNMEARQILFKKWSDKHLMDCSIDPNIGKKNLFIDMRLEAEQLQIFVVQGGKINQVVKYKEYLFDDSQIPDAACTFKQTSHVAAIIAGTAFGYLTNWVSNIYEYEEEVNVIPFFHEYYLPLNKTVDEYVY
jgi:molybdopterin/thiamine biosynthesis adenylyltransferase